MRTIAVLLVRAAHPTQSPIPMHILRPADLPVWRGSASVAPVSSFPRLAAMARKKAAPDFEHSLAELQTLVERMESGELSLEDSLTAFEQGIGLTRECQAALAQAEQKVQILLERDGELQPAPFDTDESA